MPEDPQIVYVSQMDRDLRWSGAAELEAWKAEHPDDPRGWIVFLIYPEDVPA